jgi:hypothetical protein
MTHGPESLPRWLIWILCAFFLVLGLGGCAGSMAKAEAPMPPPPPPPTEPMEEAAKAEGEAMPPPPPAPAAAAPSPVVASQMSASDQRRSLDAPGAGGIANPKPQRVAQATKAVRADKKTASDVPSPIAGANDKPVSVMLIYKAELIMGVFETTKSMDEVERIAVDAGGYLVIRDAQTITVRVPAEKFRDALAGVTKVGDVLGRNVSVRDVTSEYYDLEIRIRNAEVMRARLEQLLAKADKVEDALAVERELERVAGELERLKGQIKLLRELVSFSTITVRFQPVATEHLDRKFRLPFGWLEELGLGKLLGL